MKTVQDGNKNNSVNSFFSQQKPLKSIDIKIYWPLDNAISFVHLCSSLIRVFWTFWTFKIVQVNKCFTLNPSKRWKNRTFISFYLILIDPCTVSVTASFFCCIVRNPRIIAAISFIKFYKHFWTIYYLFVCMWLNSDMLGADDSTFIKFCELEMERKVREVSSIHPDKCSLIKK